MAIATEAAYLAKLLTPYQTTRANKPTSAVSANGHLWSLFSASGLPTFSGTPTASTCNSQTQGALAWNNIQFAGGVQRLARWICSADRSATIQIVDRLVQTGGLDGTVTGVQNTNLPTPTLPTRNGSASSAVGVWAAIEIYSPVGTTSTTATASYTNSSGTAGRTTQAVKIGTAPDNVAKKFIILPPQTGDVGVQSVESISLAGTTGTAGNFGVTLFRPLTHIIPLGSDPTYIDAMLSLGCTLASPTDDSCLMYLIATSSSSTPPFHDEILWIAE